LPTGRIDDGPRTKADLADAELRETLRQRITIERREERGKIFIEGNEKIAREELGTQIERVVLQETTCDRDIRNPMKASGDAAFLGLLPCLGELGEKRFTRARWLDRRELGRSSFALTQRACQEIFPPALDLCRLATPPRPCPRARHSCRIARVTSTR